ncbi:C-C motif chemokine 4-like [Macrotis lagotis]|uniref:C-C motif chemokine 4-like n=1 Tax=Macrotis lagotis TaxID=92651 RepID=UPI003D69E838
MASLVVLSILIILVPGFCFEVMKEVTGTYNIPNACCFQYSYRKIRNVVDCYETSSHCPKPGIICMNKRGQEICIHPRNAKHNGNFQLPKETSIEFGKPNHLTRPPSGDIVPYLREDFI